MLSHKLVQAAWIDEQLFSRGPDWINEGNEVAQKQELGEKPKLW
jgi:hypothetical protein